VQQKSKKIIADFSTNDDFPPIPIFCELFETGTR